MALTQSQMMELGTIAPDFSLLDTVSGETLSLADIKSDIATVIMFICNHCPFVHHVNAAMVEVANAYQAKGIQFVAISSNDVRTHPQDGPTFMTRVAQREGYPFPYLYDETQEVAQAYQAACTPDFFVFDKDLKLAYRGRFDETRPGRGVATGADMKAALDHLLADTSVPEPHYPSMGCNIKWK
ncbi:MAG: thioredoxin family protein [Bacteroidota bacterium]